MGRAAAAATGRRVGQPGSGNHRPGPQARPHPQPGRSAGAQRTGAAVGAVRTPDPARPRIRHRIGPAPPHHARGGRRGHPGDPGGTRVPALARKPHPARLPPGLRPGDARPAREGAHRLPPGQSTGRSGHCVRRPRGPGTTDRAAQPGFRPHRPDPRRPGAGWPCSSHAPAPARRPPAGNGPSRLPRAPAPLPPHRRSTDPPPAGRRSAPPGCGWWRRACAGSRSCGP